ncbi:MAG: tetratricopeptide repeat protein [Candidatus Obscuribacterales bacterium]|jgi:tetratricopeptide (TPR) repeat protein|nr:tetratricopeptide repeat protein [Candidatus Obscuribacterales bacterium]
MNANIANVYSDLCSRVIAERMEAPFQASSYSCAVRGALCCRGHELRAWVWNSQYKFDNALADFNSSILKDPDASPDVYSGRAQIYERLGMYNEAISDLKMVLKVDPNYSGIDEELSRLSALMIKKANPRAQDVLTRVWNV